MANKKINQLVAKASIISTDIFAIGDASTGQLYKKTIAELQAAIGGAVVSVNGLVGTVVLDTDDVQELTVPTNKYFTDARARASHSLTVTGASGASTYSSSTGVLNVPTYTLAGLGGITATFLNAGAGITYNSTTGAIASTITQYTDALSRASVSLTVTGASGASTYSSATGVLNIPTYTLSGLGGQALATNLTSLSGLAFVSTSFVKMTATGTFALDTTVYTTNVGTVTSVAALTLGTTGTDLSSSVATGTVTPVITLQVPNASASNRGALLAADWTTFNSKQATISLTTTGTSGVATFVSNVLNIPNYGSALSGYLPLTGGTLTGALTGTSATFSGTISSQSNGSTFGTVSATGRAIVIQAGSTNQAILLKNSAGGDGTISATGTSTSLNYEFSTYSVAAALTILNNGNVGIGTTSPAQILDVRKATASGDTQFNFVNSQNSSSGNTSITSSIYLGFSDDSGGLANVNKIVSGKSGDYTSASTASSFLAFHTTNGNTLAERMRITSAGNVLIGTSTDGGYKLYVAGSIYATGTIVSLSDERFKKNLAIIENPMDKLMKLNGYAYQMKSDDSFHYGVIAQELEGVLPYAVSETTQGVKGVEYNQIIPLLIEAIKEQNAKISNLETILASK